MTLQPLLETLDVLTVSHEELLNIAKEKQQIIVDNNVDSLNRLVQRESRLLKLIDKQDAARAEQVRALVSSKGLASSEKTTLADIERLMTRVDEKQMIAGRRERLLQVFDDLHKQNELNQQLLNHSIRFVNYSLDLLSVDPGEGMTYRPPAETGNGRGNRYFDSKA